MTTQAKFVRKNLGVIVVIAVVVLVNLIVDWLWFEPENVVTFVITEAVVLGAIVLFAIRRRPPEDGGGGHAGSNDVANLVP